MQIEVEDIKRLAIYPGETLVVRLRDRATREEVAHVSEVLKGKLPEGVKLLVTTSNVDLSVVSGEWRSAPHGQDAGSTPTGA